MWYGREKEANSASDEGKRMGGNDGGGCRRGEKWVGGEKEAGSASDGSCIGVDLPSEDRKGSKMM